MGPPEPAGSAPVRILRIAAGGDGVGRLEDGLTVFVPRTAPGDLVAIRDLRRKRGFAHARLLRVLEPGAGRTEPGCPHYDADECGGCQLQHLASPAQRAVRQRIVGDALRRIGHLDTDDPVIEPALTEWGYRARIALHAAGGRIGFRPLGRPADTFALRSCHIARDEIRTLWDFLRERQPLLPERLARLTLRVARDGHRHVVAEVPRGGGWRQAEVLARELGQAGLDTTLWCGVESEAPAPVHGGDDELFPAAAFEQVNPAMGDRIREVAVAALAAAPGETIWDLYAGVGETTALLVNAGADVVSVELDEHAVAFAVHRGPPARRFAARVEDVIESLPPPDRVITNPPRTGMHQRVVRRITALAPRQVVYVSCDPATLARDIARLGAGFRLASLTAFDLFPQTAHVETVAVLERG